MSKRSLYYHLAHVLAIGRCEDTNFFCLLVPQNRDSVIINRLITHYDTNQLARVSGGKNALVKAIERSGQVGKAAHIRAEQRAQRSKNVDFTTRVGYKGNSQKHYRDELPLPLAR